MDTELTQTLYVFFLQYIESFNEARVSFRDKECVFVVFSRRAGTFNITRIVKRNANKEAVELRENNEKMQRESIISN